MRGREAGEMYRSTSALELLFDLCFVVAVSQAAAQLHHGIADGHLGSALCAYAAVFFAIWWAWMNFTWFASAFDTDDVPYRLLTLLQMAGVLVLASGVPAAFAHFDFKIVTFGYVVMRVAMITQWLRAGAGDSEHRSAAVRYAVGIAVVQAGWIARLWAPRGWAYVTYVGLVIADLAVPAWAEYRGSTTSWHPGHITERYGGFTIIVLGEVILATAAALQSAEHSLATLEVAVGGLLLVFGLWWIYFAEPEAELSQPRIAFIWGYGHYAVFGSVAALGAGLQAALDADAHHAALSPSAAALAVAAPVTITMLALAALQRLTSVCTTAAHAVLAAGAVVVLALAFCPPLLGLAGSVLGMGIVVAVTLGVIILVTAHESRRPVAFEDGARRPRQ
jgi:low temperature requirement protein LtrA